jgi:hypothetical protein
MIVILIIILSCAISYFFIKKYDKKRVNSLLKTEENTNTTFEWIERTFEGILPFLIIEWEQRKLKYNDGQKELCEANLLREEGEKNKKLLYSKQLYYKKRIEYGNELIKRGNELIKQAKFYIDVPILEDKYKQMLNDGGLHIKAGEKIVEDALNEYVLVSFEISKLNRYQKRTVEDMRVNASWKMLEANSKWERIIGKNGYTGYFSDMEDAYTINESNYKF